MRENTNNDDNLSAGNYRGEKLGIVEIGNLEDLKWKSENEI